jgi:hypothetical protein
MTMQPAAAFAKTSSFAHCALNDQSHEASEKMTVSTRLPPKKRYLLFVLTHRLATYELALVSKAHSCS